MKRVLVSISLLGAIGVAALSAHAEPIVIYNPSQSVPSGFYVRADAPPRRGDFVTVSAVRVAPEYAALRDYADRTDRFLKRIAADAGQRVCAEGDVVSIDGAPAAMRVERDAEGRLLPTWGGCRTLAVDEVLLFGDTEDSFDGRYWGPVSVDLIEGVWRPL